ncbi:MAG: hypothetical protein IJA20_02180 [Methanocorpusculum sp.]|nr:hypothetical protein [Oscillospiraceae bacterium]MBQ3569460.1 hypothetical protein [Methanocorpusculum sp.]
MEYEAALCFVNEKIQCAVDSLKSGRWIVLGEDNIIPAVGGPQFSYTTKKDAIFDFGCRCLDARRIPKVKKLRDGVYEYYVKDCDDGHDKSPVSIIKLTNKNLGEYQDMLRLDLETIRDEELDSIFENPLYADDDARKEAIVSFTHREIYECIKANSETV